ncbi:MAG: TonB-dependent receptor [Alphaproteobacteria bacterium]|nr:TonB-dependent receptor [Alphaproteobacteria bacterium]MDE2500055.1 TonB-dependent receptor [Alphaproteobacteria bacterium]
MTKIDIKRLSRAVLYTSACAAALATAALAQTTPIETITVTAPLMGNTALAVAPTSTPLDAVEPTSLISQDFIEKNMPLSTNYDEAIKFSPSVFDTAPNGPGLAESQNISIRGFQDGQFNVTFDGIPWGDSNDFTHHTTSYFMAHDLGAINVDRGPGTGATIGDATFGGSVYILSKAPSDTMTINPYGSYGSFNTANYGVEFDSGTIDSTGGTRFLVDAEGLNSSGYLTNEGQNRKNIYLKVVQPLGANTTLALVGMYNYVHQNISLGATAAEIAQFGPNYGLSKDPTQQNYYGYNYDHITTDFEYLDLASQFGDGWSLDSKVYTYAYFHHGYNGEDPNGTFPNEVSYDGTTITPGVPGQVLQNSYRSFGTITRLTKDVSFGDVKAGFWYDQQFNARDLTEVDMSNNLKPNLDPLTGAAYGPGGAQFGIDRQLTQTLQTAQPYLQIDWNVTPDLTLSPGVRYSYFDRNVNSVVNVKTGLQQNYNQSFGSILPSVEAHYTIDDGWTAYAQVARGFLAPNENFFNQSNPGGGGFSPETTWNYQAGTSRQMDNLLLSGDIYYITFTNFIKLTHVGGNTIPVNLGGVTYKGLEGEATYMLGGGFSIYANGSLNSAKQNGGGWISNAPETTWTLGGIYSRDGLYGSLLAKYVGARVGDGLDPFLTMDATFGYDLSHLTDAVRDTWLKVQVNNLTNVTKIVNVVGSTIGNPYIGNADSQTTYWTEPGRSVFVSLSVKM